jgi:hypothetical protein
MARVDSRKDFPLNDPLPQEACELCASPVDAHAVLFRLATLTGPSAVGGFDPESTIQPVLLSRAIFQWWWVDAGHRHDFDLPFPAGDRATPFRCTESPAGPGGSATADTASAGRPGEQGVFAGLSMEGGAGLEPPNLVSHTAAQPEW